MELRGQQQRRRQSEEIGFIKKYVQTRRVEVDE